MKKFFRTLAIILCLGIITPLVVPNIGSETVQAKTKIKLNCTKKTIYKGDIFKLKITGTKKKVKWSSSNKTIATVSSKGVVKGIGEGTAKITAKVGKKKYTCKVNVNIIIKLNQTNLKLNEGDTYQLNTIEETKQKIEWRSSNPEIATVDSNGLVKAINGGDDEKICDIIATIGGNEYICNVIVTGSLLNVNELIFEEGETKELWIIGNKQDVTWSSEDENVAIVLNGNVIGKSAGTTNIIATTETKTYKCKVTITKKILVTDMLVQDSLNMRVGETTKISVSPMPINSTEKFNPVFTSNDMSIINVSPEGNVIANKSGQAQIVVSFKDIKKIINVTVEKTKAELIEEENNRYKKEKQDLRDEYNKSIDVINSQLTTLYNQGYYLGSYSDYQQEYNDVNKYIIRYTRQITVLEGDTSDENRKTLRELRSKLQDAQEKASRLSTQWANREMINSLKDNKVTIENNYNSKLNEIEQIHNQNINNIQNQK